MARMLWNVDCRARAISGRRRRRSGCGADLCQTSDPELVGKAIWFFFRGHFSFYRVYGKTDGLMAEQDKYRVSMKL